MLCIAQGLDLLGHVCSQLAGVLVSSVQHCRPLRLFPITFADTLYIKVVVNLKVTCGEDRKVGGLKIYLI